jgi:hypothetical protein
VGAPEAATEIVADVAEEVAEQATNIADVSRGLAGRDLGLVTGGLVVGLGVGGALGFIFTKKKLEAKYEQIAADQIAEAQAHYYAKLVAQENEQEKGSLEEIVKDRGYIPEEPEEQTAPPMAVTPPSTVVDRAQEIAESEDEVAGEPPDEPVDEAPEPVTRNVFRDNAPPEDNWDWHKERAQRSPLRPYVIHLDEREDETAYDGAVTYTYYEADDVVCNERDEVISPEDRERIIGEANLEKFGHGSDDANVVYVRNPQLEMDMEIIKSPNSYAEEVHGFEPEIKHSDRRRGRIQFDDD